jgi:hypothetical protein
MIARYPIPPRRPSSIVLCEKAGQGLPMHQIEQNLVVGTLVNTDFPATASTYQTPPRRLALPCPASSKETSGYEVGGASPYPVPEELFVRTLSPVLKELVVGTPRKEWPDMIARYPIPPRRPSSIVLCEKAGKDLPMYQIEPIPDPIPKKLKNGWRPLSSPFFAFGLPD